MSRFFLFFRKIILTLMLRLKETRLVSDIASLKDIPAGKVLINTINAYSYTMTRHDSLFAEALAKGDYLIPDGASIVKACRWLNATSQPKERVAGWDLFISEMTQLEGKARSEGKKKVMFVGSTEETLEKIRHRAANDFPHLCVATFSPPYRTTFSEEENTAIVNAINRERPDLLWIGMTAPKQEKWLFSQWKRLDICCHAGTIGAVFDFYAGNIRRAPQWWQDHSLEWLYRLISEPRRMWRRYIIGNMKFLWYMIQEK